MEAFISGDVLLFLIIVAGIAWLIHDRLPHRQNVKARKLYKKEVKKRNVKKSN